MPRPILAALAILAAACATAPRSVPMTDARRLGCERGDAHACASLGLASLTGFRAPRDESAAAAFYMAACERGDGQSCADLGALYAAGAGVRRDDGRACDLGLEDACARAHRAFPATPRAPSIYPVSGYRASWQRPARDPDSIADAIEWAELSIPAEDREPLGLTPMQIAHDPPATREDLDLVRPLVELRRGALDRCLASPPGGGRSDEHGLATFRVQRDGRTTAVRVRVAGRAGPSEASADCIAAAIASWEFPRPRVGGRVLLFLGRDPAAAPALGPAEAAFENPKERDPGCLARRLDRAAWSAREQGWAVRPVTVKFAVQPDGSTSDFVMLSRAPLPIARAVREAVEACEFEPGMDASGKPAAVWVTVPFTFGGQG